MTTQAKAALWLVSCILCIIAGWVTNGWRHDSVQLAIDKAAKAASVEAAKQIAQIEVKNTVINQKVIERIKTETVYSECKHSPDTFGLILEAYK